MQVKPFLINAILGNSKMLVTLTGNGEIQRIFWPHVDSGQHVQRVLGGVSIDGNPVLWQDSPLWETEQAYERDQNVLATTARLPAGLTVRAVDAATPGADVLVRHLRFTNSGQAPAALRYTLYQWVRVDENPLHNTSLYDGVSDSLIHYRRDLFVAAGADRVMTTVSVGRPSELLADATAGRFGPRAVLHGDVAAAGAWDLGLLAPGESAELTLFWALGSDIAQVRALLARARSTGAGALLAQVRAHWTDWLSRARPLQVPDRSGGRDRPTLPGIPAPAAPAQIGELYRRSLLVFKLMSDEATGAVIAAPEFDPTYASCGGYAYCWGRDAAYITVAMDLAGYHDLSAAFYRWALGTQEPEGWWMHRHLASGHWGPSWGLIQVDETGSILYGMALHARLYGGAPFARTVWGAVVRAADWLTRNIDPETGLPFPSDDLWEERTAEHTYSSGAVMAGLAAAAELAELLGEAAFAGRYRAAAEALRTAILRECLRDGSFLRGRYLQVSEAAYQEALAAGQAVRQRQGVKGHPVYELAEDPVADSSLLGMAYPFGVVAPDHPVMLETSRRLVDALWTGPAGGMRRYVGDQYRGGNPWILCTLWLGLYQAERGQRAEACQILDWAVARQSDVGLLAEQVDMETGRPVWVMPLTWSHAMYVLLALELYGCSDGAAGAGR